MTPFRVTNPATGRPAGKPPDRRRCRWRPGLHGSLHARYPDQSAAADEHVDHTDGPLAGFPCSSHWPLPRCATRWWGSPGPHARPGAGRRSGPVATGDFGEVPVRGRVGDGLQSV